MPALHYREMKPIGKRNRVSRFKSHSLLRVFKGLHFQNDSRLFRKMNSDCPAIVDAAVRDDAQAEPVKCGFAQNQRTNLSCDVDLEFLRR